MSQAPVQPNHRDAIQEFLAWFESAKVQGQVGPARTHSIDNYFIPFPKVSGFFKDSRQYRKILDALWPDTDIPIHPESVAQDYTTVFCILLCINKGHYIEKFARDDDLSDRKLPFTAMPSTFPISTPDEDFFGDFFRAQWHFCAPALKYRMERRFGPNHILPIVHKQPLGSGGSAQTFQIIVASAYDQLDPTTGDERAQNQRHAHTYALKTFHTRDAEEYYQNESRAYRLVAPHRSAGLLNYYGCFEHDGSYNLLLEFADEGTLEGYFEKHEPPQTAQDIYDFWCGMLGLAEAVLRIHSAGGEDSFDGWHQDVKPENILVVSGGRPNHNAFRFKLSDLGLSHFKKSKGKEAADGDTYGTRTYGAPECFRVDGVVGSLNISVKQNVDIWSLGCVWSEAAVWVISGKQGCFHDGTKVLDLSGLFLVDNKHFDLFGTSKKSSSVSLVFLIDDAASMSNHWEDVKTLFGVLAYMVKRSDPDGVELRFTIGKGHYRSGKSSELVDKLIPVHPAGDSDIRMGLNSILSSYAQDTQKQNYGRNPWDKRKDSSPRRPLNLYVFTDGVWQPDCNVEESIRAFVKKFLQLNIPPGDIGIQFIRFGNDPAKKKLFDHLDSGLNLAMDIIDTEPHNGNVWKMLLGAINTWFDDDDGETRVDNGEGPSGPPA
ncbi:hypothetical protein SLS56_001845 [Neofusicoccum ribis]|uniref:Protein kinase domain-containing protein n=1 Tax=Neofusicoccum ribis TaxID=45134 RepID=A0ABR3T694_9PEZI